MRSDILTSKVIVEPTNVVWGNINDGLTCKLEMGNTARKTIYDRSKIASKTRMIIGSADVLVKSLHRPQGNCAYSVNEYSGSHDRCS